ncbi:MAG: hypothetical protein EBY61_02285 [Actinobacteria bacterium]|nr:hypothetical protein [Actinomycetota bacterium]
MGFNAFIADYAEEFDIDDARWLLLTYSLTVMAMRVASAKVFMRVPRRALATFAHGTVVVGALLLATADGVPQLYVAAFVMPARSHSVSWPNRSATTECTPSSPVRRWRRSC